MCCSKLAGMSASTYAAVQAASGCIGKVIVSSMRDSNIHISTHNGYKSVFNAKRQILGVVEDTK
jgi:hypothetical protein